MISYAQNREDVVLARSLKEAAGFYIDAGAASPELHSVTKHFYDRGWHGINVEPLDRWHGMLERQRPRDVNVLAGLSDHAGELEFYDVGDTAGDESTFSSEVAEVLRSRGHEPRIRTVEVTTLAAICEQHVSGEVDFLKVDVEGWELHVLQGGDWDRFRPVVVVVESTVPGTSQPVDARVGEFMRSVGYLPALFDGINRFHVRADREELLELLSVPANVTDDFVEAEVARLRRAEAELAGQVAGQRGTIETLESQLRLAQREIAAARREALDAEIQFAATRAALERLLADKSV